KTRLSCFLALKIVFQLLLIRFYEQVLQIGFCATKYIGIYFCSCIKQCSLIRMLPKLPRNSSVHFGAVIISYPESVTCKVIQQIIFYKIAIGIENRFYVVFLLYYVGVAFYGGND